MAEWAEPCEWGARSNKVLRENLIAKTSREASHADSQKVRRVTGLRMLCVREKQTRARRVEQTGKEHTLGSSSAGHVCGDCEVCCWGAVRVMCGAVGAGSGERPCEGRRGRGVQGLLCGQPMRPFSEYMLLFLLYRALGAQEVRQDDLGHKLIC